MITTDQTVERTKTIVNGSPQDNEGNILEEKVNAYKKEAINQLNFKVVIKPAIISFVALLISFFLDLASVPLLGNITAKIAKSLFPNWQANTEALVPYSFWWIPVIIYLLFILLSYSAWLKLKKEVTRRTSTETIDKILSSYITTKYEFQVLTTCGSSIPHDTIETTPSFFSTSKNFSVSIIYFLLKILLNNTYSNYR